MEDLKKEAYVSWDIDTDEDTDEVYILIAKVYTPKDQRGTGVARRLLQEALAEIAQEHPGMTVKLVAMALEKEVDLERLCAFYESEGFDIVGCAGDGVLMKR